MLRASLMVMALAGCATSDSLAQARIDTLNERVLKLEKRHDLLLNVMNYQGSGKSNWFCEPFACYRSEALCTLVSERGAADKREKPEKCLPRRAAFCRGIGYPLFGATVTGDDGLSRTMTCHALLSTCERITRDAGGVCIGVE